VRSRRKDLRQIRAKRIVDCISDAAHRWANADFTPRVRATQAVAERTGYSLPVVEYAFDQLFLPLIAETLENSIASEIGSLSALDDFIARPGKPDGHASPIGRVCIISSRTTIGVGLLPALYALCAKCDVTVKDRQDALVGAFFGTLAEEDEAFAHSARAQSWDGARNASRLTGFDVVVAFGTNRALQAIRGTLPADTQFVGFGSRASAGYVTAESLAQAETLEAIAAGAARDLVLFETEGCLSLHVLFLEVSAGLPPSFVPMLARHIELANAEFPIGQRDRSESARVASVRKTAEFRASTGHGAVYSDAACSYVLEWDPPTGEPPPLAPRCLAVIPVCNPQQAASYLRQHHLRLEALACSQRRTDVLEAGSDAGGVRLTRFGELQRPPAGAHHGGRPRIGDFIRWIDREI